MLNRELQESMNLPPFINTVGGLGEPLPARRGKDEERGKEGGRGEKEGEEGSGWCAGVGAVEEEQDGGRVWPGWSALASWSSAARVELGWMGGPQISAPLSHGHVTGRGQWHRQYLNQLHCSSAIRGEASRRGSYWRQGRPCGGRAGCQQARRVERGLRMFENG